MDVPPDPEIVSKSPDGVGSVTLRLGTLKGKIWMADDFDDPLPPEIMAAFAGD